MSGAKGPAQRREFGPWPDKDGAWSIVLEWAEIGGRLELASLSIRPWAGVPVAPITTTTLRQMPIAEWRRELIQRWEQRARDDQAVRGTVPAGYQTQMQALGMGDATPAEFAAAMTGWPVTDNVVDAVAPRAGRPAYWTVERLQEVAGVYGAAFLVHQPPTTAVAAHFKLSAKGAAKVVGLARKAGLIPPSRRGQPSWWDLSLGERLGRAPTPEEIAEVLTARPDDATGTRPRRSDSKQEKKK